MSHIEPSVKNGFFRYQPGLDLLRFIFALMVIGQHTKLFQAKELGGAGVTGFFVLSGFLITSLLMDEQMRSGSVDLKAFYVRRVLRIWPLYFLFLIGVLIAIWISPRFEPFRYLQSETSFLINDFSFSRHLLGRIIIQGPLGHIWSISVEEHFYFFWPLVFVFLKKRELQVVFLFILALSLAVLNDYVWNRFIPITIGCLIAYPYACWKALDLPQRYSSLLKGFGFLAFLLFAFHVPNYYSLGGGILFAFLILSFSDLAFLQRVKPLIFYLGAITYSMYLLHPFCIRLTTFFLNRWSLLKVNFLLFFAASTLSIMAGLASYVFFEKLILDRKKSASHHRLVRNLATYASFILIGAGIFMTGLQKG